MIKRTFFLSVCTAVTLFADNPLIRSIAVVQNGSPATEFNGVDAINIGIPCHEEVLKASLEPFLGAEISEENLESMRQTIIDHYVTVESDSLILVQIPEQIVTSGCITIEVLPACIDNVCVTDNRWFSDRSVTNNLRISSGEMVQENELLNAAAWVNRNPFIHTDLVLSKGDEPGQANLEILAKDRLPARFYAGSDNTGSSFSGNTRFWSGANFSIGLDNLLTYQFTSAYSFPEFISHLANWTYFLPWKHEIVFYGGYATIHPNINSFDSKGSDVQGSMRYVMPIKPLYTAFQHQVLFGTDYKQTNSSLFFLGALPSGSIFRAPVNQKRADLFQFYLAYQLEDAWCNTNVTFKFESLFSPFIFLPHQTSADYNALREGADIRYYYSRISVGSVHQLPKNFSVSGLLRAQVASGALLPSEQFGLGGYDTVRGYQERVVLADNAIIANFEIRSPYWSFFCNKRDSLVLLAFVDTAYGYNWHASPAFPVDAFLMGIGGGFRYNYMPNLQTRLDYGFRVHQPPFANAQIGRIHFSACLSY